MGWTQENQSHNLPTSKLSKCFHAPFLNQKTRVEKRNEWIKNISQHISELQQTPVVRGFMMKPPQEYCGRFSSHKTSEASALFLLGIPSSLTWVSSIKNTEWVEDILSKLIHCQKTNSGWGKCEHNEIYSPNDFNKSELINRMHELKSLCSNQSSRMPQEITLKGEKSMRQSRQVSS